MWIPCYFFPALNLISYHPQLGMAPENTETCHILVSSCKGTQHKAVELGTGVCTQSDPPVLGDGGAHTGTWGLACLLISQHMLEVPLILTILPHPF